MRIFQKIKSVFLIFSTKRVLYSIMFNFRHLPLRQAKKFPIVFYKHAYGKVTNGGKIILSDNVIRQKKKIFIGFPSEDFEYQCEKTVFNIEYGTVYFNGGFCARRGAIMDVKGEAIFEDDVLFGPRCRVRIHNKGYFGKSIRVAHETQVFDTNFHFMEKIDAPGYYPISKPISIGNFSWIGNRCTVGPGSKLPDYTIVASNSLVNKDFSSLNNYSIIGGIPAKFIREGWTRVWDTKREFCFQKREFPWYAYKYRNITL